MNDLITERITMGDLFTGKQSLKNLCASCHNLFGKRGNTGPELTGPNRTDVAYLINNIMINIILPNNNTFINIIKRCHFF